MLNSVPIALIVGVALGFMAGLGAGGGSLLILWLTLVVGMEQNTARSINLMFFLPTAVISSYFRWKHGFLNFRKTIPGILFGCFSAVIFTMIGKHIASDSLEKAFGILLLIVGLRELFYRNPGQRFRNAR